MQAIVDPNKQIEYSELPDIYPPMLLKVRIIRRSAEDESLSPADGIFFLSIFKIFD